MVDLLGNDLREIVAMAALTHSDHFGRFARCGECGDLVLRLRDMALTEIRLRAIR